MTGKGLLIFMFIAPTHLLFCELFLAVVFERWQYLVNTWKSVWSCMSNICKSAWSCISNIWESWWIFTSHASWGKSVWILDISTILNFIFYSLVYEFYLKNMTLDLLKVLKVRRKQLFKQAECSHYTEKRGNLIPTEKHKLSGDQAEAEACPRYSPLKFLSREEKFIWEGLVQKKKMMWVFPRCWCE